MALLFHDGFDLYASGASGVGARWSPVGTTHSIVTGRNGNGLSVGNAGGGSFNTITRALGVNAPTVIVGIAILNGAAPGSPVANKYIVTLLDSGTEQVHLRTDANGRLAAYRGATLLATGSTILTGSIWHYVEFKATINNTTGVVVARLNGVQELNATSQNTRQSANNYANQMRIGVDNASFVALGTVDDVYICDATGSANNDFLGDTKVETVRPTSAGNSTQFTPSAGSNWQNVDDATPNDDTDYNASSTAGHIDLFTLGNLATTAGSVKGIQVVNRWRKDDAGSRTARRVIRIGSTNYEGSDRSMSDSYTTDSEVIEQNPNTSAAWTITNVNDLEAGYKVQS